MKVKDVKRMLSHFEDDAEIFAEASVLTSKKLTEAFTNKRAWDHSGIKLVTIDRTATNEPLMIFR